MNQELRETLKNSFILTGKVLLLVFITIHAFNIEYAPVTGGLDPSWQYIINYSAYERIEFIFTSGPFGFINYPLNIGSNLDIAILFRLLFWICFSAFFSYLVLKEYFSLFNVLIFAFLFAFGSSLSFDYIICFVVLFLLSLAFSSRRWYLLYALVIGLSALLGLVKLSAALLAISSCVVFTCITGFLDRTKAFRALLLTIFGLLILFFAFYMLYDPSFSRMFSYLRRAFEISSGYNVAMSMTGREIALWLAFFIALAYLLLMFFLRRNREISFFLAVMFLPSMFFAFKHGFVRQDGHETIFFAFISLIMGLIFLFTHLRKSTMWALFLLIPVMIPHIFVSDYRTNLTSILGIGKLTTMSELVNYTHTKEALNAASAELLQFYKLPSDWLRTIGNHSISIFPWETAYAPANKLNYRPFPVIQAYSAYTSHLDLVNANYLENSESAPSFILVEWLAINNRHALMDVPAMWLSLYKWYNVERYKDNPYPLCLLKRRETPRFHDLELMESREYRLEEFIEIPVVEYPVAMKLWMKLDTLGALSKIFFRVPEVTMDIVGTAGHRIYRIIPDTLSNGLFINFLPISLQDMYFLMNEHRTQGKIYGIKLSGEGLSLYKESIHVEFYRIPDIQVTEVQSLDLSSLTPESSSTDFNVESIYGYKAKHIAATHGDTPSFIIIRGWAVDSQAKDMAGGVYIDIDGTLYSAYYGFPKEDIAAYFSIPAYRTSGFQAGIPASEIGKGDHLLSIIVLSKDRKRFYSSEKKMNFEIR